jgi:glycosyltransferase involved in cell wall biosynthesis
MVQNKISVLMPAYNSGNFISKTIESILNQTYSDFEYLIIDDCSSDNTLSIIKSYSELDHRIKFFSNEVNRGISFCRNFLGEIASGEYIAIIDSDDICEVNRLMVQINYLKNNKNVFGVGSDISLIDKDGASLKSKFRVLNNKKNINFRILFRNCFNQSTMMLRNRRIKYDDNFPPAEDFELWSRLVLVERFCLHNLADRLVKYRIHQNNNGNSNQIKQLKLNNRIVNRNFSFYLNWELTDNELYICHHHYNPNFVINGSLVKYIIDVFRYYFKLVHKLSQINAFEFKSVLTELFFDLLVRGYAVKKSYSGKN